MNFLLEMVSSFHCASPDMQLAPSNQLICLKSEEVGTHLLKLMQSLRRDSVPMERRYPCC